MGGVTERKPPGMSFETWVDRQITQAQERGDFARLPAGPLKDLDREQTAYDWALAKARREGVDTGAMLPAGLRLRRERDDLPERAARLATEAEVRALAEDYNARVEAFWRLPAESRWAAVPGLADVEALVEGWARDRPPPQAAPVDAPPQPTGRRRWWRRR